METKTARDTWEFDPDSFWQREPKDDTPFCGEVEVPRTSAAIKIQADTIEELNTIRAKIAAAPDYDRAARLVAQSAIPDMAGSVLISVEAFRAINAATAKAETE